MKKKRAQFSSCGLCEKEPETDWKKASVTPVFTKGKEEAAGGCRLGILTAAPGKSTEQILLQGTSSV